jgi:hypothetical protein
MMGTMVETRLGTMLGVMPGTKLRIILGPCRVHVDEHAGHRPGDHARDRARNYTKHHSMKRARSYAGEHVSDHFVQYDGYSLSGCDTVLAARKIESRDQFLIMVLERSKVKERNNADGNFGNKLE